LFQDVLGLLQEKDRKVFGYQADTLGSLYTFEQFENGNWRMIDKILTNYNTFDLKTFQENHDEDNGMLIPKRREYFLVSNHKQSGTNSRSFYFCFS
jgi:hypothetical protein